MGALSFAKKYGLVALHVNSSRLFDGVFVLPYHENQYLVPFQQRL